MLSITSHKIAKKNVSHEYGCVMIHLPQYFSSKIIQWGKDNISEKDICNAGDAHGREKDIHITAKYGLHTENVDEIKEVIKDFGSFDIECEQISRFTTGNDFDVIKISVTGDKLHDLHRIIGTLKNSDEHPVYKPHATIAYINKGTCNHLSNMTPFKGDKINVRQLVFSSKDGTTKRINLSA